MLTVSNSLDFVLPASFLHWLLVIAFRHEAMSSQMKIIKKINAAYEFFSEAEEHDIVFSLDDIVNRTGWAVSTVESYRTKKWHAFLTEVDGGFKCKGLRGIISYEGFVLLHSQKSKLQQDLLRPQFSELVDVLIDKSREAALLAVQIYNNPLMIFRTSGFITCMIIAHTSLFQAVFERDEVDYWYKNEDGTPKTVDGDIYYWDISRCVKEYYGEKSAPEKENLKLFIKLRNKIEHHFCPAINPVLSGYCQALLFNYEGLLVKEFGEYFSLGTELTLALQLSTFRDETGKAVKKIHTKNFEELLGQIDAFRKEIPQTVSESPNFCFRAFLIPKIANHENSSDISIEFVKHDPNNAEDMEKYEKHVALIKEKQVQVADQGKYRPKAVIAMVRERTGIEFNQHLHTNAWKLYKVRTSKNDPKECNTKYCQYSLAFDTYVYTDDWVDFLCKRVVKPDELQKIRSIKRGKKQL